MEIEARHRQLAAAKEVPLLRLQAASGLPVTIFGLLCGLAIFILMVSPGLFPLDTGIVDEVLGPALFFGATFAILASFTTPVYRGAANDLRALKPILPMAEEDLECLAMGLTRATAKQIAVTVAIGFVSGLAHSYILGHHGQPLSILIPLSLATVSLWVVMVTTLSKMILNAAVFSRLGVMARPDLLRPSRQAPFGAAAIRPAMFLIGTWCAYPLLLVNDDSPPDAGVWIGLLVSLLTLLGIVALPLGGIRERIRLRRREILRTLDDRLEALHGLDLGAVPAETLRDMDTILDMRERVAQAPAWPLDLAGVRRILLYIVLPPLTWAAAALVEMMIDGAL